VPKGKAGIMGRWEIEDRRWKMEDGSKRRRRMLFHHGGREGRWKMEAKKKVVSSSGLSIVRRNGGSAAIDPRYILGGFQTRTGTQPGAAVLHYFQISSIFFASLFPLPSSI